MVNWNDYKYNQEISITIIDGGLKYCLRVMIMDYEYNLHRHPHLVDLKVVETNNDEVYPIGSVLRLPVETKDTVNFLLFAPCEKYPNREFNRKLKIPTRRKRIFLKIQIL